MIKPDGVQRGLVGEVINRFERRGYKIVALKTLQIGEVLARDHYHIHKDKPFFEDLIRFITSSPVVALVVEGQDTVTQIRAMVGATDPKKALPGTIRGDFGIDLTMNIIHASDSRETAMEEIPLYFSEDEILDFELTHQVWLDSKSFKDSETGKGASALKGAEFKGDVGP